MAKAKKGGLCLTGAFTEKDIPSQLKLTPVAAQKGKK
jgi:hypothetical protein